MYQTKGAGNGAESWEGFLDKAALNSRQGIGDSQQITKLHLPRTLWKDDMLEINQQNVCHNKKIR